ncbi:MAG TPA: 5-formyltetrahydrofolate cyclo-ligase, partial [Porphyromonadaceae bacterium]|nr:5-formyltetrahydrofolate cyclo-ligase [Porphyromonadaceae bacterium]
GVAFDRTLNRLGRGKGFYDRLLPKIKAPKTAICFDFQVFDNIPVSQGDIKMNMIVCQNEIIVE